MKSRLLLVLGVVILALVCLRIYRNMSPNPEAHYGRALDFIREEQYRYAVWELREVIRLDPGRCEAYERLGFALYRKDEPRTALKAYEKAIRLCPERSSFHTGRGLVLERLGRGEEARKDFEKALTLDPRSAEARFRLAARNWEEGRAEEGKRGFEEALGLDPENSRLRESVALRYIGEGDRILEEGAPEQGAPEQGAPERAAPWYESAVSIAPSLPGGHFGLGRCLEREGRSGPAAASYRKALDNDPQFLEASFLLYRLYERMGEERQAEEERNRLRSIRLGLPDSPGDEEEILSAARRYAYAERWEDVGRLLDRFLVLQPRHPEALLLQTKAHLGRGRIGAAKRTAEMARIVSPEAGGRLLAEAFLREADDFRKGKNFPAATAAYRECLALAPEDPEARLGLARALSSMGKIRDAILALEKLPPPVGGGEAERELALLYRLDADRLLDEGELDPAEERLRKAVRLDDTLDVSGPTGRLRLLRGKEEAKRGRYREAVADLSACLKEDPGNPAALLERGAAYYRMGKLREAEMDILSALSIRPDLPRGQRILKEIYERKGGEMPVSLPSGGGESPPPSLSPSSPASRSAP